MQIYRGREKEMDTSNMDCTFSNWDCARSKRWIVQRFDFARIGTSNETVGVGVLIVAAGIPDFQD